MDYLTHIDTIRMELSILYFRGLTVKILRNDVFMHLKIALIVANSADPDTTFNQGLHCLLVLPKYLYTGIYMYKCRIIANLFSLLPHDAVSGRVIKHNVLK